MVAHEQVIGAPPDGGQVLEASVVEPPALRELFEEHAEFVCRSLRRLGVLEADLDDTLQEVFLVVHKRRATYRDLGRARSWLYSICTRVVKAQRRRRIRRRENLVSEPPLVQVAASQEQRVETSQALVLGNQLLGLLTEDQRAVFVLYEVEDMSMSEVARALGCPLQTAYSRLHAARKRILIELERRQQEGVR